MREARATRSRARYRKDPSKYRDRSRLSARRRWEENPGDRFLALGIKLYWQAKKTGDKQAARGAVAKLLAPFVKPRNCRSCGCVPAARSDIEAHHEDYFEPLRVRWMCRQCHAKLHASRSEELEAAA